MRYGLPCRAWYEVHIRSKTEVTVVTSIYPKRDPQSFGGPQYHCRLPLLTLRKRMQVPVSLPRIFDADLPSHRAVWCSLSAVSAWSEVQSETHRCADDFASADFLAALPASGHCHSNPARGGGATSRLLFVSTCGVREQMVAMLVLSNHFPYREFSSSASI